MDLILQTLRNVSVLFGDVLILVHPCQLPPVRGSNVFCSPSMIASFNVHALRKFARVEDPAGNIMLQVMWDS